MASGKRYYWIKLKESFMTSDAVDYLMSQPNGAQYVVLYQMLCLKTINTDGRLSRQIGEMIIPYDVDKIQRDCKWFSTDTIRVALNMFKAFGLIYEDVDGTLVMADHENLVGSETDWAIRKKIQRENNQQALPPADEGMDIVHANVHQVVHEDIRDKILDTRDKRIDTRERVQEAEPPLESLSYYMDAINPMPPSTVVSEMKDYVDELSDKVVLHAIQIAVGERKVGWNYIRAILRNYKAEGVKTMEDVLRREEEHERRKPDAGTKPVHGDSEPTPSKWAGIVKYTV